jgi:carbon storage regulator
MLVLSRKKGDSIVIDGSIKVTVIEVRGNMVRLGVEAPQDVRVHRGELAVRIRAPQRALASA